MRQRLVRHKRAEVRSIVEVGVIGGCRLQSGPDELRRVVYQVATHRIMVLGHTGGWRSVVTDSDLRQLRLWPSEVCGGDCRKSKITRTLVDRKTNLSWVSGRLEVA